MLYTFDNLVNKKGDNITIEVKESYSIKKARQAGKYSAIKLKELFS